jgi:FKBP-type peptidyl-prolyl cis-trans isomerase 2
MALKNKDFIEIEFTGRLKDGEIFDSNIKEDLEKLHAGHNHEIEAKPFVLCLGEQMFLKAIDDFLIGKDAGEYELDLPPEKAFGARNPKLIMRIPSKIFAEHKINPVPGEVLNFDGRLAKILTVSGGRVMADFNNPLAGKEVVYRVIVKRKIENIDEKIKAMINFLFRRDLDFEIKGGNLVLSVEKPLKKFAGMFGDKFKELFNLGLEVKEIEEKKEEKEKFDKKIQ